jgi:hypothetical protein
VAALVSIAIAGCDDNRLTGTAPESMSLITTSSTEVLNPKTGKLELLRERPMAPGVSASIAQGQTLPGIIVPLWSSSLSKGAAQQTSTHKDAKTGKVFTITRYWPRSGGPSTSQYDMVNGKLQAITVFTWTKTATAYYATKAVTTVYLPSGTSGGTSTVVAQTTVVSKPCNPKIQSCPPAQMVRGTPEDHALTVRVIYALAMASSSAALAQSTFSPGCWVEWATYLAAAGALMTAMGAVEADWWAIGYATAAASAALWTLEQCMEQGETAPSPLFPGSGSGGGGGAGGAGGGYIDDCSTGGLSCPILYPE